MRQNPEDFTAVQPPQSGLGVVMPPTLSPQRVYPAADGQAGILCPHCLKRTTIDASKYVDVQRPLKVQCGCGHTFAVIFKARKFNRKDVHLPGRYTKSVADGPEMIILKDLSLTGLKFQTRLAHDIQVDDVLKVDFVLDNPQGSRIVKTVRVKYVQGRVIGAEFRDRQAYNTELTYYRSPDLRLPADMVASRHTHP